MGWAMEESNFNQWKWAVKYAMGFFAHMTRIKPK